MGYRTLKECIDDLAATGHLVKIQEEVDAELEAAEIHRRVFQAGGPAILYSNVKGCRFSMVSNLFGTMERVRFIFRDSFEPVQRLMSLRGNPREVWRHPLKNIGASLTGLCAVPRTVSSGPIMARTTTIDQLPQQKSWPDDGGAFITLPLVYTEDIEHPGLLNSNLGMYRIQISGGNYQLNKEVGMHYQIHRGIGIHHAATIRQGQPLRVNIFVGGPPALSVAAVMPLPEKMPEIFFAGALGRRRVRVIKKRGQLPILADADFCITGTIDPENQLPEGPFGDHLGYYSKAHDFPVLRVEKVMHRENAIWPFTVVGRSPQEDTMFGKLIHELTAPVISEFIPGVHQVHAVDAAGVHPLLLAIGSERYVPYDKRKKPMELLTEANAILGQGQLSLAKYLMIVAKEDNPRLDIHHIPEFLFHLLERVQWERDLHFQTCTTMDTLDYSGGGLNEGSKLVIAAVGDPRRVLPVDIPSELNLPSGFSEPRVCLKGIISIKGPAYSPDDHGRGHSIEAFCTSYTSKDPINQFPLIIIVDDSQFTAKSLNNFLWVTFTRSNPAADIYGIDSFTHHKHWGCRGSLIIDARSKPHHAPPLIEDPKVTDRVDSLGERGGPLHGII